MRPLALLGLLAAALLAAGDAAAHAQLVAADPPAGAVVATAPATVALSFSEPVSPLAARWFPAGGGAPIAVTPEPQGDRLLVPVPAALGTGTQVLSWRVVSADGHPVGASLGFSIGAPTPAAAAPAAPSAWPAAAARYLVTVALVLGVGGAVAASLVARASAAGRLATAAALAVPPLALLALGLHGLDLLGAGAAALAGAAPWRAALASPFAACAGAAALAGLTAAIALPLDSRPLALAAWALAALSFAVFGHAADAPPRWLSAPAVALHASAFLFWIGALPVLAEGTLRSSHDLLPALRRFSALAVPLVAALILSGATLALLELRHPSDLVATPWGRLLTAKLALVAALLALAARNRLRLTPAVARRERTAAPRLHRSITAEIVLAILILAFASAFRLTPPPRALDARPAEAYAHLHGRTAMADATLTPGRPGPNTVALTITDETGAPLDPLGVTVALADPARGVEPIRLDAARDGEVWRAGPLPLPHAGAWDLTVRILVSDFAEETLGATVSVGP